MILMARVENESKISHTMGADQGSAIHHLCHLLKSLREADVVDCGRNRWEGAQDTFAFHPGFVSSEFLRVPGLGLGHASGHPKQDHVVGGGNRLLALGEE